MQKYLGIYIEENLIKYAKVSREKEQQKVETFGIRFFENNVGNEIKKVIEETASFNTPISINLANEQYLYFDIFALLSKKDIAKTVETEFEIYCDENKHSKNGFETRYAIVPNPSDDEKLRAINIFINNIELNRQLQRLEGCKVSKVVPISVVIGNIAKINKKENQIIVNMEETTTITKIVENQIFEVETMEVGSKEALDAINRVENSYSKAYEICKNTTIYTADLDQTAEEQPYLQYIIPTIYKIANRIQTILAEDTIKYQTVYLTGDLSCVNNIDLYFQEILSNIECKILKPNFINESTTKINIKDYIEVNSAIALAVAGLGSGIQELNFKKTNTTDKLSGLFKIEKGSKGGKGGKGLSKNIDIGFSEPMTTLEFWLARGIGAAILIMIIYCIFSLMLSGKMKNKYEEIQGLISEQLGQISLVEANTKSIDLKTEKYKELISDLKKKSEKISDIAARRNAIPNLLNQIMFVIPKKVQLITIENTTGNSIVIKAQSTDYDQLGHFITAIKTKKILKNTVTSSGIKNDGTITITIEGELP